MNNKLEALLGIALLGAMPLSCDSGTSEPGDDDGMTSEPEARDNRVELPPQDDDHYTFVGGEIVIEPGEDKMYCFYLEAEEDMALTDIDMLQGEFGHHAIIVRTTDPKPPGTVEDCSDDESTSKFSAFLIPVAGAPENAAFLVEKGTQVVLQSHYVNASDEPILIRDAVHTRRLPMDEVETWMSTFTTTSFGIEIMPGENETELTFDCAMDRDVDLLNVGGHMHESGTSFEVSIGPSEEELERIYFVDKWIPEFRDVPPVELYGSDPLRLTAGTIVRTTCRWENTTGEPMHFPEEMCAAFGVLAGTQEIYDCRVD